MLEPSDMAADPQAMLQDLAQGDPRMAMLLQMMQPQRPAATPGLPDDRDEVIAQLSEKLDEAETRLARVTRVARQLHEVQQVAAGRLSRLAAALGACGACWGEDGHCPACHGRGRPGMVRPDVALRTQMFGQRAASSAPPPGDPIPA